MSRAITALRRATLREWVAHHEACPWATFFHGPGWAAAWSDATDGLVAPDPHLVEFDDGASAVLVFSWRQKLGGLVRTALSTPGETYGGWVSADPLGPDHARLLGRKLAELTGNLRWRLNPFDPQAPLFLERRDASPDETLYVDVDVGFDVVRAGCTKGHRSAATKAAREGVTVRVGRRPEDWRAYEELVADTLRRWGEGAQVIRYPDGLLQALARRGGDEVRLWLAEKDGEALAGAVCLYGPQHVAYWHGAARADALKLRPVNLLLLEAMRHACEQPQLRTFDMGSSGPLEGVAAFKRSFGARPLPCPGLSTESEWRRWARRSGAATRAVLGSVGAAAGSRN